jgi:hypothetical protein
MTKQELIDALTAAGVPFEKTQKVDELRALLDKVNGGATATSAVDDNAVKYIRNKDNGRVFVATPTLLKLPEMEIISEADYNAALAG